MFFRFLILCISLITCVIADPASQPGNADKQPVVIVIPVSGTVDATLASFISRALHENSHYSNAVIVLEMDTFGGEVDAAFQIVDTMVNVKHPTIAYVKTKAISAGALIALSCNKLVMKSSTTIGDVAPLMISQEGPKMLGEKYQSPIRAKFRTLAKRNGYPERLTEAMVTEGPAIYEVTFPDTSLFLDSTQISDLPQVQRQNIVSTKTVVRKGELLTMDDSEAHRLGFSSMSVGSFDEMLNKMNLQNAKVIRIERSWSEEFVGIITMITPILLMIGFAALYIEYKHPGLIAPAAVAALCLGLVFFSHYLVGLANYTELLILAAGVILLGFEIFVIPGFGIAGVSGIALIVLGIVLSLQDFVVPNPQLPWQKTELIHNLTVIAGSLVGSVILVILFFRFILPKLGLVVKGPYLEATLEGAHADSDLLIPVHAGDKGVVVTALRPSGKISIGDGTYDVVADGEFIDRGTPVVVREINGTRIVVSREVS